MPIPIGAYTSKGLAGFQSNGQRSEPTSVKTKGVSYSATQSDKIIAISNTAASSASDATPNAIEIENTGTVPIMLISSYRSYSDDTSDDANDCIHVLLPPGDTYNVPVRAVISSAADNTIMFGTAVDNLAPDSNEYTDSTANVDSATASGIVSSSSSTVLYLEPYTSAANCTANLFRVNDLVRIRDEVMRVTAIGDKSNLANNKLTVERGVYGSTAVTAGADADPVRLPFFNAYHDYDKYSVAQTDSNGQFKCFNFFGQARSATESSGIVPGSFNIKFYQPGYQELGLSGQTASSTSGLTASGSYWFKIALDGGTAESINFTADSSNTNWGGANGVLSKIQTALDDKYNNTASNTWGQRSTVSLIGGDIRFTSGQGLATSAVAITAGVDGASAAYNLGAQQNGYWPTVANLDAAIAAKLPDDVVYDNVTYATRYNDVFGYDDGWGNIKGACTGTINYETGALNLTGCPVNAEFVVSALTNSAFSGKLNESETDRINSLIEVSANTPSTKKAGTLEIRMY